MKTLIATLAILTATSASAFAAPAVTYMCVGKDAASNQAVNYEVMFSNSVFGHGYGNQSITVTQRGWEVIEGGKVFQMAGAKKKNKCKKNEMGETYLPGSDFSMEPTADGQPGDYIVSFKAACGEDATYDVKGVCFFQY